MLAPVSSISGIVICVMSTQFSISGPYEGLLINVQVGEITVHPQYNASSFSRDLSILKLRKAVEYTEFIRAACLWPENQIDLTNVIGKKGSVSL